MIGILRRTGREGTLGYNIKGGRMTGVGTMNAILIILTFRLRHLRERRCIHVITFGGGTINMLKEGGDLFMLGGPDTRTLSNIGKGKGW